MGKPHLDLLALAARLLEGLRVGESANVVSHVLVDVSGYLAAGARRASHFEVAFRAVGPACSVGQQATLVDEAGMRERLARRADIHVALPIEGKVLSAELAIGPV